MQEDCIKKKEDKMPNRGHKCYENYTYEGFMNKYNKIILEGEQIKERKYK
jgi:hypothetical protein